MATTFMPAAQGQRTHSAQTNTFMPADQQLNFSGMQIYPKNTLCHPVVWIITMPIYRYIVITPY